MEYVSVSSATGCTSPQQSGEGNITQRWWLRLYQIKPKKGFALRFVNSAVLTNLTTANKKQMKTSSWFQFLKLVDLEGGNMLGQSAWTTTRLKARGNGTMAVRRMVEENASRVKTSILQYKDILETESTSQYDYKLGDWKDFPKQLSDLVNSPLTKAFGKGSLRSFTGTKTRDTGSGSESEEIELADAKNDFQGPIQFSRFLRRANLIPPNALQSGSGLPSISTLDLQDCALENQQAAAAVGYYFGDLCLAESAPNLGILMGSPSREDLEESLGASNLASLIVANALQDKLPQGRPVNVSFNYEYEAAYPESGKENTKADLYVRVKDCKTQEDYAMFPLAHETQNIDRNKKREKRKTVRTQLHKTRDKIFMRESIGQFSLSSHDGDRGARRVKCAMPDNRSRAFWRLVDKILHRT